MVRARVADSGLLYVGGHHLQPLLLAHVHLPDFPAPVFHRHLEQGLVTVVALVDVPPMPDGPINHPAGFHLELTGATAREQFRLLQRDLFDLGLGATLACQHQGSPGFQVNIREQFTADRLRQHVVNV